MHYCCLEWQHRMQTTTHIKHINHNIGGNLECLIGHRLASLLVFFSFRISVIFRQGQIKRIQLPDKTLIRRFVPIIAITVAYLVAWTSANRNTTQTRETNAGLKFTMCTENWWSYSAYGSRKYSYFPVNKIDICYELGITFY